MRALILSFASLASASLVAATVASAEPALIATANIDPNSRDLSAETAAPLENGVPGNLLGGVGSGLAYAGNDTFLALPDRGPNAKSYNPALDDTSSYITRFQTFSLRLTPTLTGRLPFTLTPELKATTLLSSATPLIYGDGKAAGVGNGAPALNRADRFYFTGRSDNFAAGKDSLNDANARFDPESLRVSADGTSVFVSDEYGPDLYQFDRTTGVRLKVFKLPQSFAVAQPGARGDDGEIPENTRGRVANKGMEGLAITPDGRTLVGIMQNPLLQDGGGKAACVRLVTVDVATGAVHQYAYATSNIGTADKPKYAGISEIVAVNDHTFLVDERDGKGRGDASAAVSKRLFRVDIAGAATVDDVEGADALAARALPKSLAFDLVPLLTSSGIDASSIPAKIEGLAFGPDIQVAGKTRHTLWIASDNDFLATTPGKDGATLANPSTIYVIGFDDADLAGYTPQQIAH